MLGSSKNSPLNGEQGTHNAETQRQNSQINSEIGGLADDLNTLFSKLAASWAKRGYSVGGGIVLKRDEHGLDTSFAFQRLNRSWRFLIISELHPNPEGEEDYSTVPIERAPIRLRMEAAERIADLELEILKAHKRRISRPTDAIAALEVALAEDD